MTKKFRWEIDGLSKNISLLSAGEKSLSKRITTLLDSINIYFESSSEENLHQVRISLRRVRYNLELFFSCFDKKIFMRFYKKIVELQDLTGEIRDIDVMKENLLLVKDSSSAIFDLLINNFELKRKELIEKMSITLFKFTLSRSLKEFLKQINSNRRIN